MDTLELNLPVIIILEAKIKRLQASVHVRYGVKVPSFVIIVDDQSGGPSDRTFSSAQLQLLS